MSKPRKTKKERLALRHVYTEFASYRRELVDRNLSADPGPKAKVSLPKREAKMLSGARTAMEERAVRFRDPWNAPRPKPVQVFRGMEMFSSIDTSPTFSHSSKGKKPHRAKRWK